MQFESQKSMVRDYLTNGGRLTPMQALVMFGSLRLSGIIFELKKEGLDITKDMVKVSKRKHVAEYYIKK